jgi:hypothetical protein
MIIGSAIFSLLLAAAQPNVPHPQCRAIPGWNKIAANKKLQWIIIGELHGTKETPEIFADAVCLTAKSRPVVVAVEHPVRDQPLLDTYIASDGGAAAKLAFLKASIWSNDFKDGRSSEAYFNLFERLRIMHKAGKVHSVIAFQPVFKANSTAADYEKSMAETLMTKTPKGHATLTLVGNMHAMRGKVPFPPYYGAMASHLPQPETITLDTVSNGGEAWNCRSMTKCGASSSPPPPVMFKRGVKLTGDKENLFSGALYLGTVTTASLPQKN